MVRQGSGEAGVAKTQHPGAYRAGTRRGVGRQAAGAAGGEEGQSGGGAAEGECGLGDEFDGELDQGGVVVSAARPVGVGVSFLGAASSRACSETRCCSAWSR